MFEGTELELVLPVFGSILVLGVGSIGARSDGVSDGKAGTVEGGDETDPGMA